MRTAKDVFSSGYPRQRAGKKTGLNGNGAGARNGLQTLLSGNDRFLKEAIGLYEHLGFQHIDYALGCTGHVDCEVRMLREL